MAPVRVAYDTIIPFDRLGRSRVYYFGRQSKGGQAWNGDPHARLVLHIAKPAEQLKFCQKCSKSDLAVGDIERADSYQVRTTLGAGADPSGQVQGSDEYIDLPIILIEEKTMAFLAHTMIV